MPLICHYSLLFATSTYPFVMIHPLREYLREVVVRVVEDVSSLCDNLYCCLRIEKYGELSITGLKKMRGKKRKGHIIF